MLFLNADFWPLFWAVIGGGAGLTALLSLVVATAGHHQAPVPAELAPGRHDEVPEPAHAA